MNIKTFLKEQLKRFRIWRLEARRDSLKQIVTHYEQAAITMMVDHGICVRETYRAKKDLAGVKFELARLRNE